MKKELKVQRTTFLVDGIEEPCILVGEEFAQVRISTMYHYIGANTLCVREILDGEFNSEDELIGDFDLLSDDDARRIAKSVSAYVY